MSHLLPPAGSPIREMFQIEDLVAIGTGQRQAPMFAEAEAGAQRMLAGNRAAQSVICFTTYGRGTLDLVEFSRTGWRGIWTFA